MKNYILLVCLLFSMTSERVFAQEEINKNTNKSFILKGQVIDVDTQQPITKVNIENNRGTYTTTNNAGEFSITVRIGDELIIKSDDFNTVYYTVKDQQRVTVEVQKEKQDYVSSRFKKRKLNQNTFVKYLDSAKYFLKKDAKKSIEFVSKSLESIEGDAPTSLQNTMAFETLGDINFYWKQYDLAIDNYKQSLTTTNNPRIKIKLAKAFSKNKNYQESISLFKQLKGNKLSSYQQVEVYEGLGDNYKFIGNSSESLGYFDKGLVLAKKHHITPKITDLNSKIATTYAQSGAIQEAENYFGNSLQLAKKENTLRAVEEKNKVADFYNQNNNFDKEIKLREETLDEINELESDTSLNNNNENPLTPQRQNYKIANAFIAQKKYEKAIPYLNKSIEEANAKKDLIVKKDATRKLSELYKNMGDFDHATKSYEKYVDVVDELYIKKEQEISQAARLSRDIALKQNRIISLENERKLNQSRYELALKNKELTIKNSKVQRWIIGSLILIAILLLITAYTQYRSVKQQKYANNLLALKSLRTQMNPHFIFNALNSVNSFIASNDERAANKYLSEFSQLMRSVLENSEEDFIPLNKEIELLEIYVKLEHFRFKDKFDYNIYVDKLIELDNFFIPPMLLQPYIENAVWHGLRYKKEKGFLQVRFEFINETTIKIKIEDNGIGREQSKKLKTNNQVKQQSKGMGNIKKRINILNKMYQDKVDVFISNVFENGEGTLVELILKKD
ncbi:MAG: tetratricopeptide repeat-containing sensor histidine kinase [Flavobacteriales bacterium]